MKKFLFTTLAVGALAVSANAACDQISDKASLDAFAAKVNGGDVSACAELTADIYYNGESETAIKEALKDDHSGLKDGVTKKNVWTPIGIKSNPFKGTFDGKNHTIYGLYMEGSWEVSFVAHAIGGVTIKNLTIADSYFRANGGHAAGFIGNLAVIRRNDDNSILSSDKTVNQNASTIDNCGFEGYIYADGAEINAGLVGSIDSYKDNRTYKGAALTISNSYNTAAIEGNNGSSKKLDGGLVGYVNNGASLTLKNCYDISGEPVVGMMDPSAKSVSATNVSCAGSGCNQITKDNNNKDKSNVNGVTSLPSAETVLAEVVSGMSTDADALNNFFEKNGSGITFKDTTLASGNTGIMAWLKPTKAGETAELSENDSIVIPADVTVDVDKIALDREYKAGILSTVMFPFTIEAKSVKNANFFVFDGVDQDADEWVVGLRPVCNDPDGNGVYEVGDCGNNDSIYANRPYFVKILGKASAPLSFADASERGNKKLTIRKTVDADTRVTAGSWSLVGVYGFTHWETSPGNVFGYSSKNPELYPDGRFVKAGDNVSVKAMRAYLYYDRPAVSPKPALMKSAAEEVLPSQLKVCIRPYVEPEIIVETIDPAVGDNEENSTLSIAKPMIAPETVKANRWYDLSGRRLNKKPTNHGSFYNKPVIIK